VERPRARDGELSGLRIPKPDGTAPSADDLHVAPRGGKKIELSFADGRFVLEHVAPGDVELDPSADR
jgi:hypothetical protein